MFGFVTANLQELTEEQKQRYGAVYCGICRQIRQRSGNMSRLALSYDMVFLALLLMSLYEPQEESGGNACILHPIRHRPWVDSEYVRYAADMNVALAYYNCLDDWEDEGKLTAKAAAGVLGGHYPRLAEEYPRQCGAIESCIRTLSRLEEERCPNPDETANCFGRLMAELMVVHEDMWQDTLRQVGFHLGRFIYLADGAMDYEKDKKKGKYNPFLCSGIEDRARWEEYLVLALGCCTREFEKLPLVQDKALMDNILYSGVWTGTKGKKKKKEKGGTT